MRAAAGTQKIDNLEEKEIDYYLQHIITCRIFASRAFFLLLSNIVFECILPRIPEEQQLALPTTAKKYFASASEPSVSFPH